jgi:alkylation response protein AidB-like acyl-CoA dehydrogenase
VDLTRTDEQAILADTAAAFVSRECPLARVRTIEASGDWHDPTLWTAMADLGWCGLALPTEYGGAGQGLLDVAVLAEQLGRGPVPSPLLESTTLAALPIAWMGSPAQRRRFLPALASGRAIGTCAVFEPGMSDAWSDVARRGAPRLDGHKLLVPWANIADVLLVATATGLWVVDRDNRSWACERHDAFAGTPLFAVTLDDAQAEPLGPFGPADDVAGPETTRRVLDATAVVQLAYAVGAAEACLDLAVRHASEREQFGRPIGAFQAVAHRCVDMRTDIDACRYLAYRAAWAFDCEPHDTTLAVAAALTYAADALRRIFVHAHQVHGASGFSTEQDLHLFTRRLTELEIRFATSPRHQEQLARAMGMTTDTA